MTSHVLFSIVSHFGRISVRIFLTVMGRQSISVTSSHSSLVLVSKPVTSHFSCRSETPGNGAPVSQSITHSTNYRHGFWLAENIIRLKDNLFVYFKIRSITDNKCSHLRFGFSIPVCKDTLIVKHKSLSVWSDTYLIAEVVRQLIS